MDNKKRLLFPFYSKSIFVEGKNREVQQQNILVYVISAILITVVIANIYYVRIADPDLWGHLTYGRYYLGNGFINVKDPFSYTATNQVWYAHEYLSQILLWLAYSTGGAAGLILIKCLIGGFTALSLYKSVRLGSKNLIVWSPVFLISITQFSRFLIFRPQLFSYLGFSIFVFIIFKHLLHRRSPLWILPVLMILWSNLHGGFIAGIGALGLGLLLSLFQSYDRFGLRVRLVFEETRSILLALIACIGATFLNPLGWRIWPFLLTELGNPYNRKYINEWRPVSLTALHANDVIVLFFMMAMLVSAWMAGRTGVKIKGVRPWQWLASCLPLALMFFLSNRHAPLLLIWSTPVFVLFAQAIQDSELRGWIGIRFMRLIFTSLVLFYALAGFFLTLLNPLPKIEITNLSLGVNRPFGSVEFMRVNHLRGNVYAPLWWGSYITWKLYPGIQVSMDGRNDTLYPVEMVGENLEFFNGKASPEIPLSYATDYLLIPKRSPVLSTIQEDHRWSKLYEDTGSALFLRTDSERYDQVQGLLKDSIQQHELGEKKFFP